MATTEDLEKAKEALSDADPNEQNPNLQELYEDDPITVVGEVERRKDVGQDNDILTLRTQDHGKRDAWIRSILQGELEDNKVTTGSLIGIKYFGEQKPKQGGRPYYQYLVKMIERNHKGAPVYDSPNEKAASDGEDDGEDNPEDIPF